MAGFRNLQEIVNRDVVDGALVYSVSRKVPAVTTAAGYWQDLSMAPGNPRPNYYASTPLASAALAQSTDGGVFHGGNVSPLTKHLRRMTAQTQTAGAVPLPLILCDYLLYYPFVDESVIDEAQTFTNSTPLSRYTDGAGVQIMAVVVAAHTVGTGTSFTVNYTNSAGVAGRTTTAAVLGTQFVNGTIATSMAAGAGRVGPFLALQTGDTGVRSIQSVTFTGVPDVGLITLVLVKPIADISIHGIDAACEVDFLTDKPSLPRIYDDAYLNFIALACGNMTGAQILVESFVSWN